MSAEPARAERSSLDTEYEMLRELGRGGTAVVHLARKRSTGAEVAIKLIRATYLEDEEALARFAREARFTARLDHPNVVPILDVLALDTGGIALIMAHVAGRTLKQLIRDSGRLNPEHAERVVRDIANGLNAAHSLGIVHRDVKPENIFIDDTGRALLADFGLARSMTNETQLTMSGVAIGTPAYMPPEQIDGGVIDARGDIYSLGLVGWEALSGQRPWEGHSLYALLYHQKHDFLPDVREMRSDVSDRLADVIATAIEKDPAARWQTVAEMIGALDGTVPARRAPVRTPVSSDTVRFDRSMPALVPAVSPVSAEQSHTATLASVATDLVEISRAESAGRRRRYTMAGAVAATLLIGAFVVVAVRRRTADEAASVVKVPDATVSAGDVTRSATPVLAAILPDSTAAKSVLDSVLPAVQTVDSAAASVARVQAADTARPAPLSRVATAPSASVARSKQKAAAPVPSPVRTSAAIATPTPAAPSAAAPASAPASVPASVAATPTRVSVVAGGMHTCLVASDGRGYCWGENSSGQLGTGAANRASAPLPIASDLELIAVTAGLSHSCAIARDGTAWCWGQNDHGQLGDRSTTAHATPVRVADGRVFRTITAGASHTCAIDADGIGWCWGAGTHGQLGNGVGKDADAPVSVPNTRFRALAAGWNFTCGLDTGGRAHCWGENAAGQLGNGENVDRRQPVGVAGDVPFVAIAAGNAHACGVTAQGDAYCWGQNTNGQLGDGTTSDHLVPSRVRAAPGVRFVSITAGARHSCAVASDGDAYCWGLDAYGQLGDGGGANQTQPVRVAGGHAFSSVRAFGSHTCGTTMSGEAFCWGYNLDGQLGDGTRMNRSRPVYLEPPTSK
jgi:serine/threonine protein kinase/alpha-tubulin suppressor-like RCC1 family protein